MSGHEPHTEPTGLRAATNSLWVLAANGGGRLFSVLLLIGVSRLLGAEKFGQYQLLLAFLTIFSFFTDLGTGQILVREIAKDPRIAPSILRHASAMTGVLVVSLYAILIGVFHLLNYPAPLPGLMAILGIALFFNAGIGILQAGYYGFHRMAVPSQWFLWNKIGMCALGLAAVWGGLGLWGLCAAQVAIAAVQLAGLWGGFRKDFSWHIWGKLDLTEAKWLLREMAPIAAMVSVSIIYLRLDMVMLSKLADDRAVGVYAAAGRFLEFFTFIPVSVELALQPVLSYYYAHKPGSMWIAYRKTVLYLTILSLPVMVLCTFLASPIIHLVYGAAYAPAAEVLPWLAWSVLTVFIDTPALGILRSSPYLYRFTGFITINLLLNAGLNWWLIPLYGPVGAAVATLATKILDLMVFTHILNLVAGESIRLHALLWKPFTAAGAMTAVLLPSLALGAIPATAFSLAAFGGTMVALKVFDAEDREFLGRLAGKMREKVSG